MSSCETRPLKSGFTTGLTIPRSAEEVCQSLARDTGGGLLSNSKQTGRNREKKGETWVSVRVC